MSESRPFHWPDGTPLRPGDVQPFGFETSDPDGILGAIGCSNRNVWLGRLPDSVTLLDLWCLRLGDRWHVEAELLVWAPGTAGTLTLIDPCTGACQTFRTHGRDDFDAVFGDGPFQWRKPFVRVREGCDAG